MMKLKNGAYMILLVTMVRILCEVAWISFFFEKKIVLASIRLDFRLIFFLYVKTLLQFQYLVLMSLSCTCVMKVAVEGVAAGIMPWRWWINICSTVCCLKLEALFCVIAAGTSGRDEHRCSCSWSERGGSVQCSSSGVSTLLWFHNVWQAGCRICWCSSSGSTLLQGDGRAHAHSQMSMLRGGHRRWIWRTRSARSTCCVQSECPTRPVL
jgi:hypothetical protein